MLIYTRKTNILKIWIVPIIFQNSLNRDKSDCRRPEAGDEKHSWHTGDYWHTADQLAESKEQ
jgi:hypothetical protein